MKLAPRTKRNWIGLALVMVGVFALSACDTAAELIPKQRSWDQAFVLSSVPMKKAETADGSVYEPMCRSTDASPDGLLFNVLLKGTLPKDEQGDNDQSIIPGDAVESRAVNEENVFPDMFSLNIDCIEPTPDGTQGCSTNYKVDSADIRDVSFFRYSKGATAGRGKSAALAIVLDMSGSMKGLVHPFAPYYEDSLSAVTGALPPGFDTTQNATDPNWARLDAVESLINNLNPDDSVILFTYNENKLDVVCSVTGDYEEKKLNCLGDNRSLILGSDFDPVSPLKSIQGDERGRSPLWTAVEEVYSFMSVNPTAQSAGFQHILVISDGPDTCSASADLNECSGLCQQYNTDYATARTLVEAEEYQDRIPVHFVQMGARGYRDRDPQQVELACLTGGHYTYVNANEIVKTDLKQAMEVTLKRIAYTFRGYWRLAIPLGTFKKNIEADEGYVYRVDGRGSVLPGEDGLLTSTDSKFSFNIGDQDIGSLGTVDRSLSVRKECNPLDNDCAPDAVEEGACYSTVYWCDADSLTCENAQQWLENGAAGGCEDVPVKIRISGDTGAGAGQYDEVDLGTVPTLCCRGLCMPPEWPMPPDEVLTPDDAASSVFFYDTEDWLPVDPDDPEAGWVAYATFRNISASVTLDDIKSYLVYENPAELSWENGDWKCSEQGNCFPAPEE